MPAVTKGRNVDAVSEEAFDVLGVDTENELDDLLAECSVNMAIFAKTFFPDVFSRPFAKMHYELCDILDDDSQQLVGVAAPRGIGKTSLFNMAFPAKRILYRDSKNIIPIGAVGEDACMQADDLKSELVENPAIRAVFGPMESTEQKDPFGMKQWVTSTGCKVRPRGAGQTVRGTKYRHNRPDLFIIDDLEDDEMVENEERRNKLYRWLFSAVVNSIDRGSNKWRIIMIGTILHEDSVLQRVLDDNSWLTRRYEICNDKYESNWPEFMSTAEVRELANNFKEDGLLDVFSREYRNLPVAAENQGFKQEFFRSYDNPDPKLNIEPLTDAYFRHNPDIETVILSDPARTMNTGSAMSTIVGISIDRRKGCLYVRDIREEQMSPDDMINGMLDMAEDLNALVLAPEVTGLHEYITWPLENAMLERKVHYVIVEVKPRENKKSAKRSGGLIPLYRQGKVWHNSGCCLGLETYLMQWPRPKRWDVIDAVAGIIYAMEDGDRYLGAFEDKEPDEIEQEYRDLEEQYSAEDKTPLYATVM
jgi:hypothetical protein